MMGEYNKLYERLVQVVMQYATFEKLVEIVYHQL
jgi:hypothetical protein